MPCPRRASPKRAGPLPPPPRAHWRPTPPAPPLSTLNCCAGAVVPRARAGDWTGTMTKNASDQPLKKQRYLALFFPLLPAERWLRTAPKRPDAPLIFAAKQRGAMRVASVDAAALAVGLRPGMPLADARAQVGNVIVVPHDPVLDQDWLDPLPPGRARPTPPLPPAPPRRADPRHGGRSASGGRRGGAGRRYRDAPGAPRHHAAPCAGSDRRCRAGACALS